MCGIAGIVDWRDAPSDDVIRGMIGRLAHRGPSGIHTASIGPLQLGHARLSILDPTAAADQPMTSADGRYTAVHNGEIYNFLELGDELRSNGYQFRTSSDTEVILAAYAAWGPACVERFNGIWAFAIWDREARRLFISRDRLGVKPLFLVRDGSRLAFASEIKALLGLPGVTTEAQPSVVRQFLLDGRIDTGRETFFAGVERLPPGHNLLVDQQNSSERRYWIPPHLPRDADPRGDPADQGAIDALREAVVDSVSLQLRSDVPIGSCLSGGLDSSTIVAVASALRSGRLVSRTVKRHEREQAAQMAFFADFPDPAIAERRYVDDVVNSTGVDLHTVTVSAEDALASLESIVRAQDEPFGSTSIVAQYHVMKLVRESGVPVLLDGQGADELLGGYRHYLPHRDATLLLSRTGPGIVVGNLRKRSFRLLGRTVWSAASHGRPAPAAFRRSNELFSLLGDDVRSAAPVAPVWVRRTGTALGSALWRDVAWANLPGLLRYEDRNSMAFGIEARVPFLDHRVVELALRLPDRLKIHGDVHKVALRRAFPDLVPKSVIDRRDKIGFESPEARWLTSWLPALQHLVDRPRVEDMGLLRAGSMSTAFRLWQTSRLDRELFWRLLSLEMWARVSLKRESLPWQGTAG
jgi:asparagine synthase (glutamine-hydrolysing)